MGFFENTCLRENQEYGGSFFIRKATRTGDFYSFAMLWRPAGMPRDRTVYGGDWRLALPVRTAMVHQSGLLGHSQCAATIRQKAFVEASRKPLNRCLGQPLQQQDFFAKACGTLISSRNLSIISTPVPLWEADPYESD